MYSLVISIMLSNPRILYRTEGKDDEADKIKKFTEIVASNKNIVIGDATYKTNYQRLTRLRRPGLLPKKRSTANFCEITLSNEFVN
jgi:hypothetical protein